MTPPFGPSRKRGGKREGLLVLITGLATALLLGQAARAIQDAPGPELNISPARAALAAPQYAAQDTIPNDPCFAGGADCPLPSGSQWNLAKIRAPAAWDYTTGGSGVVVAVLDAGFDLSHPDLAGKFVAGYDFVDNDFDPSPDPREGPLTAYGTALAGIVAATTNNQLGIAGTSWHARIMPLRVITRTFDTENLVGGDVAQVTDRLAQGIRWAADPQRGQDRADVILVGCYLTGLDGDQQNTLRTAIAFANGNGSLVVAGVGEQGANETYPAGLVGVVGVVATNPDDETLSTSTSGSLVDLAAPGQAIPTTWWESGQGHAYTLGLGSEFGAAQVAGLAALLRSMDPSLGPEALANLMQTTAEDLGDTGHDEMYGYGRIDAARAIEAAPHFLRVTTSQAPVLEFNVDAGGGISPDHHTITNTNTSALTWQASTEQTWLLIGSPVGNTPSVITVTVQVAALAPTDRCGTKVGLINIESTRPQAFNPQPVQALLRFPEPCATPTPSATATAIPTASSTPTRTPTPTGTLPTATPTGSPTSTPTLTGTPGASSTPTATSTYTRTPPPTIVITVTPTNGQYPVYLPIIER
jgi:subtilisin family serine protease